MVNRISITDITKEQLLKSLIANNYNQSLVAEDLGVGTASVSRLMYKYELKSTSVNAHVTTITKERLLECVLSHNMSKKKAGEELGISKSTVERLIEKYELKDLTKRVYTSATSKEQLLKSLEDNNWVQSDAAKELGISNAGVVRLIEQYGLRELSKTGVKERFSNCLNCDALLDSRKSKFCCKKCTMAYHAKIHKIPMFQAYQELLSLLKPSTEIFQLCKTDNNLNLNDFSWCFDGYGYLITSYKYNNVKMHRLIWMYFNGNISDKLVIDHINHDPADNRLGNLRLATYSQNMANQQLQKPKSSQYKGVYIDPGNGKYVAEINWENTRYRLGTFDTEIEAAKAYDAAAKIHHKQFAHLNFPDI